MTTAPDVQAGPVVRPAWRRARIWIALGVVLVIGAVAVNAFRSSPGGPLDPNSSAPDGSHALQLLLGQYGVDVHRSTDLEAATGAVVVAFPDYYSDEQLRALRQRADRLVLLGADDDALTAVGAPVSTAGHAAGRQDPGCDWPGAAAAGPLDLPDGYSYLPTADGAVQLCYGGSVAIADGLTVLGANGLVRNSALGDDGVAAVAVNAVSDSRADTDVTWLLPGSTATAAGPETTWALFPDGARRVFLWLLLFGVLLALWRGRRFGRVVTEPLPVVVRAAELVEGHGRLYRRAGARDRAAAALRAATLHRLAARLGVDGSEPRAVVDALADRHGLDPSTTWSTLAGPVPADDAQLLALAEQLDAVEATARPPEELS